MALARGSGGSGGVHRRGRTGWPGRRPPASARRHLVRRPGTREGRQASRAHEGRNDRAPHGRAAEAARPRGGDSLARHANRDVRVPGGRRGVRPRLRGALRRVWALHLPAARARGRLGRGAPRCRGRHQVRHSGDRRRTARGRSRGECRRRCNRGFDDDRLRGRRLLRRGRECHSRQRPTTSPSPTVFAG